MLSIAAAFARAHVPSMPSPVLLPAANTTLDHDSPLRRRSSLMYSEMPKTASGSLRRVLPYVVKGCELPAGWSNGPKTDLDCGCYATTGPNYAASEQDRLRHFVIGTVREPCDWYRLPSVQMAFLCPQFRHVKTAAIRPRTPPQAPSALWTLRKVTGGVFN